jgi:RHS repeat-associated protein
MNFETFEIDDFPTIGATELDVSSGGSSSVDETSGGTTTQTWIVYNGNSNTPFAEFNGSGTLLERYLAGPTYVPGVTGMVARTNASGVTDWYLTGKLGSVRDIVDTSGTVIDHISYGAFGTVRAETNPSSGSQFKFDGMRYNKEIDIYYDYQRYYNNSTGMFTSQDISGFNGEESNLYQFVLNQPNNLTDSSGTRPDIPPVTISIGVDKDGWHVATGIGTDIGNMIVTIHDRFVTFIPKFSNIPPQFSDMQDLINDIGEELFKNEGKLRLKLPHLPKFPWKRKNPDIGAVPQNLPGSLFIQVPIIRFPHRVPKGAIVHLKGGLTLNVPSGVPKGGGTAHYPQGVPKNMPFDSPFGGMVQYPNGVGVGGFGVVNKMIELKDFQDI